MMGHQAKQTQWWSDPVNVFARIPEDHILRRLNRCLDLDFVRTEVASKYGRNGQVSVDPVVIMKMMLLLFLDDVKSERELMRIIPLRLDYLYFLGYGLEDTVPNHSVLSKARCVRTAQPRRQTLFGIQTPCVPARLHQGLITSSTAGTFSKRFLFGSNSIPLSFDLGLRK
jgi:transposase